MSVAAHVCERDTETGYEVKVVTGLDHETVSGSVQTPIHIRQNACERLSVSLVFESATLSSPGTLLIRSRLAAACNYRKRTSR